MSALTPVIGARYRIRGAKPVRDKIVRLVREDRVADPLYRYVLRVEVSWDPKEIGHEFAVEELWFSVRGDMWPREHGLAVEESS